MVADQMSALEQETPLVKSHVARFGAQAMACEVASLAELAEPFQNGVHYPLFLLCLQSAHRIKDKQWLVGIFNDSKINLQEMLPGLCLEGGEWNTFDTFFLLFVFHFVFVFVFFLWLKVSSLHFSTSVGWYLIKLVWTCFQRVSGSFRKKGIQFVAVWEWWALLVSAVNLCLPIWHPQDWSLLREVPVLWILVVLLLCFLFCL